MKTRRKSTPSTTHSKWVCRHPGCKNELEAVVWIIDGEEKRFPACGVCETCLERYYRQAAKSPSVIEDMKAEWGNYRFAESSKLPKVNIVLVDGNGEREVTREEMIERIEDGESALLCGDTGVGKTMSMAIAAARMMERGVVAKRVYAPALRESIAASAIGEVRTESKTELMRSLYASSYLFIDDIGSAKPTEAWDEALKMVIEHRLAMQGKPCCISLQQSAKEFIDAASMSQSMMQRRRAIIRRIRDHCIIFKLAAK